MEGKKRERRKAVLLIVATVVAVTVASLLFLFYTKAGKRLTSKVVAGYLHDVVTYIPGGTGASTGNEDGEELPQIQKPADVLENDGKEKEFYHILLLGEEAIRSTPGKGRTDAIILATVHVKEKKIILTSVLRDTYAYRSCVLNDFFSAICKEYFRVFKAVAVSARVKYSVGFYTNSFLAYAGAARKSVILHKFSPYMFCVIEA